MLYWPDKDPDEIADYQIDWVGRLDGDSIAASTWVVPSGIIKDSDTFASTSTTIWLSGGAAGETYVLVNRITTVGGREFDEPVQLRVVDGGIELVTLQQAKRHLRVDHDDDDDAIAAYLMAATTIVVEYVDRAIYGPLGAAPDDDDGTAIRIAPPITAAILLLTGDMYEQRLSDAWDADGAMLPKTVRALLAPYRVWRVISEGC